MLAGPAPLDAITIKLVSYRLVSAVRRDPFALRKMPSFEGYRLFPRHGRVRSGFFRRLAKPSSECDGVRCEYGSSSRSLSLTAHAPVTMCPVRPFNIRPPRSKEDPMVELSEDRLEQLEKLVSTLRHDVRGIVTPVALATYHLYKSGDPAIQHSAARIDEMVERLVVRLNSTYGLVPPSCDRVRQAPPHNCPNNVADATRDKADAAVSA